MVQTRSTTKIIKSGQVTEATLTENFLEDCGISPPAKKRRREDTGPPKKRRRGKPGEICQLNLDVLSLIAEYIYPIDLLNLARTCRSLRQLLMSKSSEFVWKTARRQVDHLPDCPADLTEPEYANLVFYARCHDCGKCAKNVLWRMRRRYCRDCRVERFYSLASCHEIIRNNEVVATEHVTVEGETAIWVDKEQMELFLREYMRSSDKEQYLEDRKEQYDAISEHARQCEKWQSHQVAKHHLDLRASQRERHKSIFQRLKQLGYAHEVRYFTRDRIELSCKALFRKSKPLTDTEWNRIWPEWVKTMDDFRSQRLEELVHFV